MSERTSTSQLQAKRVLVTGAGGYIGRHVVVQLLDRGAEVIAIDRDRTGRRGIDPRAKIVIADVLAKDSPSWEQLGRPDVCIHLAWQSGFDHSNIVHMSNLSSHYYFLRSLLDDGLAQLVVIGTMHEIGYYVGEIGESSPAAPQTLYGVAKNALRLAMEIETARVGAVFQWLRCFYIYGDDRSSQSIFSKILAAADSGMATFPMNSGTARYDFVEVNELGRQIAMTALQSDIAGVIHCGAGEAVPLRDQVERFVVENELTISLEYGKFPDRPYDAPATWGDPRKIREIVGG